MKEYKFEYHSELPIEFVDMFKVDIPAETRTYFNIDSNMIVQEFEDDTVLCITRDDYQLSIHSNKKFNQTIPVRSKKVIISFDE